MTSLWIICIAVAGAALLLWAATAVVFHFIFSMKKQSEAESVDILRQKGIMPTAELPLERLTVKSDDGLMLTGYYVNQFPESKRVVIIAHGYRSNHIMALQYAPVFLEHGYNVLVYDQRAHGDSDGRYPSYGLHESRDLHRWVHRLQQRVGEDCEICLMGHSMGGAAALCYPHINPNVRFIVADSTYATLRAFVTDRLRSFHIPVWLFYPLVSLMVLVRCGFLMDYVNPIDTTLNEGREIPVLFIHSKGDSIISCCGTEEMYKQRNNPHDRLYLHENAEHPDVYAADTAAYKQEVAAFLNNLS